MFARNKGRFGFAPLSMVLALAMIHACALPGPSESPLSLLTYNASDGIRSLVPAKATDLETMWVVDQLYEGLLELDAQLRVVPALAETWSVSEDGLRYAFGLRQARFHNGTPLTAHDVAASFARLLDSQAALPGRWVLKDLLSEGGVEIMASDSLHLHLSKSNPVFASLLATPQASILSGGGKSGDPDREDLGTGPFILKGWLPETALVLHSFPDYWMRDSVGHRLPYLDGVRVEFNREEGAEMLGFRQGKYDFVSAPSAEWMAVFFSETGDWKPQWADRFEKHSTPYLKTDYIGILLDSMALEKQGFRVLPAEVRLALSLSLNRRQLVRELRADGAAPAVGFVPPGMPGFDRHSRAPLSSVKFDLDSAKRLLSKWGIDPTHRLGGLTLGTKPATADLAAALQHTWAALGVDVDIDVAPSALDAERVAKGQVPLFRKSWLADYPDAENFLGLFDATKWSPNGPNYTHYSDPDVQDWLGELSAVQEPLERQALLRKIEAKVMGSTPLIPLWHDEVLHLVSRRYIGWQVSPTNRLELRRVRLSAQP